MRFCVGWIGFAPAPHAGSSQPALCSGGEIQSLSAVHQRAGFEQTDPATLADALDAKAWAIHAAGEGSKGLRLYDWARISRGRAIPVSNDGFSSAAAGALPVNGPITSASLPPARRWPNSQAPQPCAGPSKNALRVQNRSRARSLRSAVLAWLAPHMSLVMAAAAFLSKLAADLRRAAASGKPNKTSSTRNNPRLTIMNRACTICSGDPVALYCRRR